jgi:hypothetical protein
VLDNGQVWQQAEFGFKYFYLSSPSALIYETPTGCKMKVGGRSETLVVKKLTPMSSYSCSPTISSRLDGDFNGWDGETVFLLQNGQVWQQSSYAYRYAYASSPTVTIYQSGPTCRLQVGTSTENIPVKRLAAEAFVKGPSSQCSPAVESRIDGLFNGWTGSTTFKLANGQVWQQSDYGIRIHASLNPQTTIYESASGCRIQVEDVDETIRVTRTR